MKNRFCIRLLPLVVSVFIASGVIPLQALAVDIDETELNYYQVVSKREWELAPGITESEVVMNTADGNKRQVSHVVEIDISNPYTKVIPSTYKMAEGLENKEYRTQIMSEQAKYAEEHGYGNVVAAMNTALHWYDTDYYRQHPELIGEPLGTLILDGVRYTNSQNSYFGAYTCLVINFDEKDGVSRPDYMPKTEIRQTYDVITGWEEQLIPVNFHFLVKNGVSEHVINDPTEPAPRSFMGIKADGTIIMVMNEGRQAPYSTGFNCYEMAEFMISLGCVHAINCDGGGSSAFLSQRPGEALKLHCTPSDGSERPTTHGVLVISTATDVHEHVPGKASDKTPTDTEPGYTGRVFCTACGAIMEEGTTIPAIGHTHSVDLTNKKIVCEFGCTFIDNGLQTANGKNYYTVNGTLQSGWIGVDDDWYYFDTSTFSGVDGAYVTENSVKFNFDNGRVTAGTWTINSQGRRYWYGPGYYKDTSVEATSCRPYEIDGKTYLFNRYGYMQTGVARYYDVSSGRGILVYYDCGEDGVATLLTGPHGDSFYKDGIQQKAYQLVKFEGDFYFINNGHKLAKNITVYLTERFTADYGIPVGKYEFDANGKMIMKHGVVGDYFYLNGVQQKAYQLVKFEDDFYFINNSHKLAKSTTIYLTERFTAEHGIPTGRYEFDADGKMMMKHGVVGDYFYLNGVQQKAYQLINFEGNYYFVNDSHKLAKNTSVYLTERFTEQYGLAVGRYEFDAEGKMIIRNGVVGDKLYLNGVLQKAYQLINFEGDYYFVDKYDKLAMNTTVYLTERFTEQYGLVVGRYEFDAEGKMIIRNGVVGDKLYLNGVLQKAYQLINFEGDYYFVDKYDKLAMNTTVYLTELFTEQYGLAVGRYEFDADGKMILKHGVVGDYLYIRGALQKAYQLVELDGDFYFVNNGNKVAKNITIYLSEKFVMDKTYADGTMLEPGRYNFGADGKMILG